MPRLPRLIRRSALLAVLAVAPLAAQEDPAEVRGIIERTNADLERFYAAGDIDSVAMYFADDVIQMPPNMAPLVGKAAFSEFWTSAAGFGDWTFDLETQDVVLSGPIAVERGRFELGFEPGPASPIPAFQDRGNYVVLWRREADGVWRIVWDAPVSELPLPGGP